MTEKNNDSSGNELSVMFPGEVLDIKGFKITMKPLPLEHLPSVIKQFSEVIGMLIAKSSSAKGSAAKKFKVEDSTEEDSRNAQVAMEAISEAITLLPYCMFADQGKGLAPLSIADVPAYAVPKLMKLFLDQNIPDDMLGEWEALTGIKAKEKKVASG